jgi:hypothetical protein
MDVILDRGSLLHACRFGHTMLCVSIHNVYPRPTNQAARTISLPVGSRGVSALAFSPDGALLAVATQVHTTSSSNASSSVDHVLTYIKHHKDVTVWR